MKGPPGLHMRDTKIEGIGPWMWRHNDYWGWAHPLPEFAPLRDLILQHVKKRDVIIQAGGCMGMYPRLWAESFNLVYTFEPDPINFYCLVANCPDARIIKMQTALAASAMPCSACLVEERNAGAVMLQAAGGPLLALPLDALSFQAVDAIQLDCEEWEENVIAGAKNTLVKHRPIVSLEAPVSHGRQHMLLALMSDLDYREVGRCGSMPDIVFAPR